MTLPGSGFSSSWVTMRRGGHGSLYSRNLLKNFAGCKSTSLDALRRLALKGGIECIVKTGCLDKYCGPS